MVGQGLEGAAARVRRGEDVLVGLVAVLFRQQLAEDAERDGGLERGAGFGDHVHVEVEVAELAQQVAEIVGAQAVAREEHLRVALAGQGTQQLNGAARAEVRAADADDDQRLRAAADQLRRLHDGVELRILDAAGQLRPAGEIGARAGLVRKSAVRLGGRCEVGAAAAEEGFRAGIVDFYHTITPK